MGQLARQSLGDDVDGELIKPGRLSKLGNELGVDGLALSDVIGGVAGHDGKTVLGKDLGKLCDQGD